MSINLTILTLLTTARRQTWSDEWGRWVSHLFLKSINKKYFCKTHNLLTMLAPFFQIQDLKLQKWMYFFEVFVFVNRNRSFFELFQENNLNTIIEPKHREEYRWKDFRERRRNEIWRKPEKMHQINNEKKA